MSAQPGSPLILPPTISAPTEAATVAFAARLATDISPGDIILLEGDLGTGKTVFARAFIRTLTGNHIDDVPSPTYTLLQTYDSPKGPIWHFDLYRLKDPDELYELGWEDALGAATLLIEWPENLGNKRPNNCLTISLNVVPGQQEVRLITINDERLRS